MFEYKLKKISAEVFNNKNLKQYFGLTHKKHKREMYFQSGNPGALNFSKSKFNSSKKRIIFFLLKLGLIQPFLKKINLSGEIGESIFIGGQIKGFDLKNNLVNSFIHVQDSKEKFIKDKESQLKLGELGFSSKIQKIDKKKYFSQEELFSPYVGKFQPIFKKLLEFYGTNKIKKVKVVNLIKKIEMYLNENKIKEPLFNEALKKIIKINYFLFTKIHGDFAMEQCLINKGKIYFVDWDLREGLITEDLVNYFRLDGNYFNKLEFKQIIKKYPLHIQNNLQEYLILTELLRIVQGESNFKLSKERLTSLILPKNYFPHLTK